jgi:uncharacterized protein YjbI with pentapeptide repeats
VMEVLSTFIRENSRHQWPRSTSDTDIAEQRTRPDVQAAITVIGRRNAKRDRARINLGGVSLIAADLANADLCSSPPPNSSYTLARSWHMGISTRKEGTSQLLGLAYLDQFRRSTNLAGADLSHANLTGANLRGAALVGAVLVHSILIGADLSYADLTGADLRGADLRNADLTGAKLTGANFTQAVFGEFRLSARSDGSIIIRKVTNPKLADTQLSEANFSEAIFPASVPTPNGWVRDPATGKLMRANQGTDNVGL